MMPGSCSSAIEVYQRGGFSRFCRAASSTAGICFSRSTSDRSLSSGDANLRLMITNALPEIPLEYTSGSLSQRRMVVRSSRVARMSERSSSRSAAASGEPAGRWRFSNRF